MTQLPQSDNLSISMMNRVLDNTIPRYKGDVPNPKGGVRGVIPSKQKY